MKKVLRKYLPLLVILLSGAFGSIYANANRQELHQALASLPCEIHFLVAGNATDITASFITSESAHAEKNTIISEENETEGGRTAFVKSFSIAANCQPAPSAMRNIQVPVRLSASFYTTDHWFLASSSRNVVLRVLRI